LPTAFRHCNNLLNQQSYELATQQWIYAFDQFTTTLNEIQKQQLFLLKKKQDQLSDAQIVASIMVIL
jgi:hypothetical protein